MQRFRDYNGRLERSIRQRCSKEKISKHRAKKSDKVKDMFAAMTEKEKKEMLKLLQNG